MIRENFNNVEAATDRLLAAKADQFFPGLLSQAELQAVHDRRLKKEQIKAKKEGRKIRTKDFKDLNADLYIIRKGGLDDAGNAVDDFDIAKYMLDAEDPATGTIRDLKIDTRQLKHAKNYYDFTMNILGPDAPKYSIPWSRQMWTGLILFGEVCPCCSDKRVFDIHNIPKTLHPEKLLKSMKLLEYGICPKCKRHKWDLIKNHGLKNYQELVNVLGQRSGKSSGAAGYFAYSTHQYLMFPSIAELVPNIMQASTQLTCTMVSLNFNKAVGVLWVPFKRIIEASSWFQDYFSILKAEKQRTGVELYHSSSLYLTFQHRNMKFYPSGPNSTTLRGDSRFAAGLDELGLFPLPKGNDEEDEQSERANADEAHKSLTNSLTTVQGAVLQLLQQGYSSAPASLMLSVSSPYSKRDKIMRLLAESRTEVGSQYMLGVNLPTWEMHPTWGRDHPVIVRAYNSNPEKAERDFGANPPSVHSRFMNPNLVKEEVFVNGNNSHNFIYKYDRPDEIYGTVEKIRTFKYPGLVTIDAGAVDNSFTLTGGHYDFDTGKSVCTTIVECMPQEGRRVNFNMMYQYIILPMLKDLNAVALLADQWQSIDILNRAQDDMKNNPNGKPRCRARQYSPRRKDFDGTVAMLRNKNIICPTVTVLDMTRICNGEIDNFKTEMINKPVQHLVLQMTTVRDVGPTRCPEKGENQTDDIWRAFVLWAAKLHDPKIMERLVEAKDWKYDGSGGQRAAPAAVFVGRSSGGFRPMNGLR